MLELICPSGAALFDRMHASIEHPIARRYLAGGRQGASSVNINIEPTPPNDIPGDPVPPPAGETAKVATFAEKAEDLDAIKKSVEDAAAVGAPLWLSYLFLLFYIAIASGAVTHADLLLERPVDLPFLSIKLPLKAFFYIAPLLFLLSHTYTLAHFALLADKAKHFHQRLRTAITEHEIREGLRRQLPINIFVQFLAGPEDIREGPFSIFLWTTAWTTLVAAPTMLLLLLQLQFLPYHDASVTWCHRLALAADLIILQLLWLRILSGRSEADARPVPARSWRWFKEGFLSLSRAIAVPTIVIILFFSLLIATYPGEWERFPHSPVKFLKWRWMTEIVFGPENVVQGNSSARWPSNSLRLRQFDLYDALKIEDPKKIEWKKYLIDLQDRNLEDSDFRDAKLPRANLTSASFRNANLSNADFSGALFKQANFHGASLNVGHFRSAEFYQTLLQGVSLDNADLVGASFSHTGLQGARLRGAQLHASLFDWSDLRGAVLNGAILFGSLAVTVRLDGASLKNAGLLGVRFVSFDGKAIDLSGAYLWRSEWTQVEMQAVLLDDMPTWKPVTRGFRTQPAWDEDAYNKLINLSEIKALPSSTMDRLFRLKCKDYADKSLQPCDANASPSPDTLKFQAIMEASRAADVNVYRVALAAVFRELVCSPDDPNAIYVLRALAGQPFDEPSTSQLRRLGSEVVKTINHFVSKDCPVSQLLTAEDKARLQTIATSASANDKP